MRSRRGRCSSPPGSRTDGSTAPGVDELGARGVYYGASASEAIQCEGEDVYVVGAANSAGQAVLNLARYARKVVMVVRAAALEDTMSQYLVQRIAATPNVEVRMCTEVVAARRRRAPRGAHARRPRRRDEEEVATSWLFVFIGASPADGLAR